MNSVDFDSNLAKFGIGLFETIKVINAVPIFLDEHLDRLYNSISDLNINFDIDKSFLKKKILEFSKNIKYKALRVTICDRGYNFSTRDVSYKKIDYEKGYNLCISDTQRGSSFLYNHKTTNYMENILMKKYATQKGFDDALFLNLDEEILECSMSNIFFVKENIIYTPIIKNRALKGILRDKIMQICKEQDLTLKEEIISIKDIDCFEFCFISNSLMDIMKVNKIENVIFKSTNDIFDKLQNKLKDKYYGKNI